MRIEYGDERTSLLAVVNDVEHVPRVATKPIEARDDQLISMPQEIDHRRKFGTALTAVT